MPQNSSPPEEPRKPPWIRVRIPSGKTYLRVKELKERKSLHTVCEEAGCPNMGECWERGHATFLILGDFCTRNCRFCGVRPGRPVSLDRGEPKRVADAVAAMGLEHAVVTSVTRDDLEDGGASIFAETIVAIRHAAPGCTVEVLIPDFRGNWEALDIVVQKKTDILGHNLETVPRLYPEVRPQAQYGRSLELLRRAKELDPSGVTKSGIMVGLGESLAEVRYVMGDLRDVGCDIFTMGQYLRPGKDHHPVVRYYTPAEFQELRGLALDKGFRWVESGPLVRSSYNADAQARALQGSEPLRPI